MPSEQIKQGAVSSSIETFHRTGSENSHTLPEVNNFRQRNSFVALITSIGESGWPGG
jgi:hypothetical protein